MTDFPDSTSTNTAANFVRDLVKADNEPGTFGGRVQTRFPPEPNGYLHIGHAKAICVDFGIAEEFGGICKLRFDDTNPVTEDTEYVDAIVDDIRWLGFEPVRAPSSTPATTSSSSTSGPSTSSSTGSPTSTTRTRRPSPHSAAATASRASRARTATARVDENLELFRRMRSGELPDGSHVLRAKADMQHENMQLRDPVMYRIRHEHHHRTGDQWCIYPTYDWAHGQSDAIEGVTHSLCSLEFDSHRALYDWYLDHLPLPGDQPRQTEFARLELTHTVTSKRKLRQLIDDGVVEGWDDPRLPTLQGPAASRLPGQRHPRVLRRSSAWPRPTAATPIELLEWFIRNELNRTAQRRMAVLRPIKLVVTNWPEGQVEHMTLQNNPENEADGTRQVPFTGELWIERDDFMAEAPPKYFRLTPGTEVRLRGAYFVKCTGFATDDDGNVTEVQCTYDPATTRRPGPRRPQGEGHHPLGVGRPRGRRRGARCTSGCSPPRCPANAPATRSTTSTANSKEVVAAQGRAGARRDRARPGGPVRTPRLLRPRPRPTPMLFHRTVGLKDEWANVQKRTK